MREDHGVIIGQPNKLRMPNGVSTATVGDLVEIKSQVHPILKVEGKINQLRIGDVRTCGGCERYSQKSEIIE